MCTSHSSLQLVRKDAIQSSGVDTQESVSDGQDELKVTFFPPLHDARRAWILNKLRQERVAAVIDIGCGEGTLLGCLCNTPAFITTDKNEENSYPTYSSATDGLPDLHIARLAGLDISMSALQGSMAATAPPDNNDYHQLPRWEQLEVNLWLGSLESYNPDFVNADCIVSTEVIEHLPETVLSAFAPTMLGLYRPRLFLITTPNYAFNARFSAPGVVDPAGYPDPTGRTDRVFRHHDHKFEWTPDEFKAWCSDAASAWGYLVEVDAIGLPNEPDPWGRDTVLGCASQVAMFRRIGDWEGKRSVPSQAAIEQSHILIKAHIHPPHPRAGVPESHDTIPELVYKHMESYYFDEGYSIWDLWVENTISIACGGRLDVLLSAIDASPALRMTRTKGAPAREWNVKFAGDKHREAVETTKNAQYWKSSPPHNSWRHSMEEAEVQTGEEDTQVGLSWPQASHSWAMDERINSVDDAESTWGSMGSTEIPGTENLWSGSWGLPKEK